MPGITIEKVENYLYSVLPERDAVLVDMEREARSRDIPIVGPAVGRLFYQLGQMSKAKSVFEMGSAIGYSTIWWARSVGDDGKVVYTDGDSKNAAEARANFERAGVLNRIDIRVGDALELLSEQKKDSFDIIFNDIDKEDYPRAFQLALPRLKSGGLFVADNVLWSGRVAAPEQPSDPRTAAILKFNELLYSSPELFTTIVPLRDGIAIARKI